MLIGISGKFESGKDTLASILKEEIPDIELKSFAYSVKKAGSIITGTPEHAWFTHEGKNTLLYGYNGLTIGQFQQKLGQLLREMFHSRIWIDPVINSYTNNKKIVITDCRQENEAEAIKERGGLLIRVNRPGHIPISTRDPNHPTEVALDNYQKFDYIIENNSTYEDFVEKVKVLAQKLKERYGLLNSEELSSSP